ncbi:MAG: protein-disulfide reductase DsbD domain-containing protein, partial [Marinilabiliaceae bacterium]
MKKLKLSFLFAFLAGLFSLNAQVLEPVEWDFSINEISDTEVEIVAEATIDQGWHLYGADLPEEGPVPTSLNLVESDEYEAGGDLRQEPEPDLQHDPNFDMELSWFSENARLILPVELANEDVSSIEGYVEFMACDDEQCLPPERVDFTLNIGDGEEVQTQETSSGNTDEEPGDEESGDEESGDEESADEEEVAETSDASGEEEPESNWAIFFMSFLAGFAALLTPCVFPMIPMTVSFFTKQSKT